MLKKAIKKGRKIIGTMKNHRVTAELKAREEFVFSILNPQVETVKKSPTVQIALGSVVSGLLLTGHWGAAATLAATWFGSKPLTHVAASGVAGVGLIDAKLRAAIQQLEAMQLETV